MIVLLFSLPATLNSFRITQAITPEPLVPSVSGITRSFTYPILKFEGQVAAELTVTITWNPDGTTIISDSRGYSYSMSIPSSQGVFTILQNSTVIDQKVVGPDLQYDIYWRPVKNSDGYVDRYKFTIVGSSVTDNVKISLGLDGGKYYYLDNDQYIVTQPAANSLITDAKMDASLDWNAPASSSIADTTLAIKPSDGLEIDWSDAIASGYAMAFNTAKSVIEIPLVKGSFLIDPIVTSSLNVPISPNMGSWFEGQKRVITITDDTGSSRLYVFYYDASNIVYKTSDDGGSTWSTATSIGTGVLGSDIERWSLTTQVYGDNEYVYIFYWKPSGSNTNFYVKRGTVNGLNITWDASILLGSSANNTSCSTGVCASVAATTDYGENIYAAFRWKPGGSSTYSFVIKKSADGGVSWVDSLPQVNGISSSVPSMTLTTLNGTSMLFVYTTYSSPNLFYRVFDGTTWSVEQTISNTGMAASAAKQISSVSDGSGSAFVAYTNVTRTGGVLKVVKFDNGGTFQSIETADSTLRHFSPSIMYSYSDGSLHIHSLANNKVYDTKKSNSGTWQLPDNPYGTTFSSPNQLTATTVLDGQNSGLWKEGSNLMFEKTPPPIEPLADLPDGQTNKKVSPDTTNTYESERRIVGVGFDTLFRFYYYNKNIYYQTSSDAGNTWGSKILAAPPGGSGTGEINSDYYRWTVVSTTKSSVDHVALLYFKKSGKSTNFYSMHGKISGSTITWDAPTKILPTAIKNHKACENSKGVCAAVVASRDTSGNIYAAFRYLPAGKDTYRFSIWKSQDGGKTWPASINPSLGPIDSGNKNRIVMALTNLSSDKMLFAYARYPSGEFRYRIFDGLTWGTTQETIGAGMTANKAKQISAASDSTGTAYIAYTRDGDSGGPLKVGTWPSDGTSLPSFQTVDSALSHSLPSITVSNNHFPHIFSLSGGKVYDTKKINGVWQTPANPFGTTFSSPDQLTAGFNQRIAMWKEGAVIKVGTYPDPPHDNSEGSSDGHDVGVYVWSRLASEGHRVELKCEAAPNDDRCKIPYYLDSSLTNTGLSLTTIRNEATGAANLINGITPYIGVSEESLTTYWDNKILGQALPADQAGSFQGGVLRHCVAGLCLLPSDHDNHVIRWTMKINSDTTQFTWGTTETCNGIVPTTWDIGKTLLHEIFHMLPFTHAAGTDKSSVVYNGYNCGQGSIPNENDELVVLKKYPAGVK